MSDEEEAQADPTPVTRVSIDTPPLSISCEQPGAALDDVVKAALALYREVFTPNMAKAGPAMGFTAERADGQWID